MVGEPLIKLSAPKITKPSGTTALLRPDYEATERVARSRCYGLRRYWKMQSECENYFAPRGKYEDYLYPTDIESAVLNKHVYLTSVQFQWDTGIGNWWYCLR